jgi:hypothetical protein
MRTGLASTQREQPRWRCQCGALLWLTHAACHPRRALAPARPLGRAVRGLAVADGQRPYLAHQSLAMAIPRAQSSSPGQQTDPLASISCHARRGFPDDGDRRRRSVSSHGGATVGAHRASRHPFRPTFLPVQDGTEHVMLGVLQISGLVLLTETNRVDVRRGEWRRPGGVCGVDRDVLFADCLSAGQTGSRDAAGRPLGALTAFAQRPHSSRKHGTGGHASLLSRSLARHRAVPR